MEILPIIEFYEYQIHNYYPIDKFKHNIRDKNHVYKFGNFTDSENCGRISIDGTMEQHNDTQRTSCDPITSYDKIDLEKLFGDNQNIDNQHNLIGGVGEQINTYATYDLDNLYPNYKEFLAKFEVSDVLNQKSIDNLIKNVNESIDIIYNLNKKMINDNQNDILKYIDYNKTKDNENIVYIDFNTNISLVLKLEIKKDDKILLFGDFHGSFHTFFRLLCRLHKYNILDLNTFKLNDNYKIIFLGDILDRGKYSLDIINIIFKLINVNNQENFKIIYNRGNHESLNIFKRDGSYTEFREKINNNELSNKFIIDYIRLLNLLPSAIILHLIDNDSYYWCSHGGFPRKFIDEKIDTNLSIQLFDYQDTIDIKWSDFGENAENIENDYKQSSRGENIINYTYNGTNKFIKKNNIKFIIRGHQDSYGNSVLFENDGKKHIIANPYENNIDNFLYYNNNVVKFGHRVNGPIARLILNDNINYFPVLTISTNTDLKRYLNADSFALLRFDIKKEKINDFSNSLIITNYIKMLLEEESNINKFDLFIRNIDIINDIIEIIYKLIKEEKYNDYIDNILIDCKNFFDYYYTKYNNVFQKIKYLLKSNYIDINQIKIINENMMIYKNKLNTFKSYYNIIYDIYDEQESKNIIRNNNIDDKYINYIKDKITELNKINN